MREVVPPQSFAWSEGFTHPLVTYLPSRPATHHVVALDFGMKHNILRCLVQVGCKVTVLPGTATADDVLAQRPDGIFLSNGPGDPEPLSYAIDTIRGLAGKKPMFGICLGHQLLGLALGGETFKLKFGHRGANQPVLNQRTNQVEITTQNHGFAVRLDNLPPDLEPTHVNLNDHTLEGMRHQRWPLVQRAVPPRGVGRAARQRLSVRGISPADGMTLAPSAVKRMRRRSITRARYVPMSGANARKRMKSAFASASRPSSIRVNPRRA